MRKSRQITDDAGKGVLDQLKTMNVLIGKIEVKRVAVVKFRMNDGSGDSGSSYGIKRTANAPKIPEMVITGLTECRYLTGKGQVLVKNHSTVPSLRNSRQGNVRGKN